MSWKRKITEIRHAAVHRVAQNRHSICKKLDAAVAFAKSLEDSKCAEDIRLFKLSLDGLIADLGERSKQLMPSSEAEKKILVVTRSRQKNGRAERASL
ncbi:hypothetical protein HAV15_003316 [Penicillium sp. str. |nr:hypothetical protein HAV15_003316 [Penicillium sp. str. \